MESTEAPAAQLGPDVSEFVSKQIPLEVREGVTEGVPLEYLEI